MPKEREKQAHGAMLNKMLNIFPTTFVCIKGRFHSEKIKLLKLVKRMPVSMVFSQLGRTLLRKFIPS